LEDAWRTLFPSSTAPTKAEITAPEQKPAPAQASDAAVQKWKKTAEDVTEQLNKGARQGQFCSREENCGEIKPFNSSSDYHNLLCDWCAGEECLPPGTKGRYLLYA
jgi:hypothetical protein